MKNIEQYLSIITTENWLLISVAVVLVMSLLSIRRQRKQNEQHSLSMDLLQRDLRALANAAVGVGGRVLEIERNQRKQTAIVTVQEQTQPVHKIKPNASFEYYNPSSQPYEQAIHMAQTGSSVDDIVNMCGLSKSEAELVNMMHRLAS